VQAESWGRGFDPRGGLVLSELSGVPTLQNIGHFFWSPRYLVWAPPA